jgi:serine/threonine protein kinase
MPVILNKKYEIIKNIGEGTFGKVFLGKSLKSDSIYAIKIQNKNLPNIVKYEAKIYRHLRDISGVPRLYNYGNFEGFNYLIMDYFNKSFEDANLSHMQIIKFLIESIKIIQFIHERGVLHRDIKPDNFLIDGSTDSLYLIDFGLSKLYLDKDKLHIEERRERKLIGTSKYSSLNVHHGIEASRRDDMESITYTFIKLYNKGLPWDNIDHKDYSKIYEKKRNSLSWMYKMPGEFITMMLYCRRLEYEEQPNYNYLINLFSNLLGNLFEN